MKRICQWRTAVGFCELSLWLSLSAVNLEMRMSQGRPAENVGRKWKMVGEKFWEGDNFVGFVLLGESKKFGGRGQSRGICVFGENFAFFFPAFLVGDYFCFVFFGAGKVSERWDSGNAVL